MGKKQVLRPSWFELTRYFLRGILTLFRHLVKHRFAYCVKSAEIPSVAGRRHAPYQTVGLSPVSEGSLSREPYLRPTRLSNSHAPEIVSLARHLRNGCNSDWDFACAIYDYVCNEILIRGVVPAPRGVVDTLQRGYGNCLDKSNLLVALARAGGIPARYCVVAGRSIAVGPPELVGRKVASIYDWLIVDCAGFKAKTRERKELAVVMHLGIGLRHRLGRYEHPYTELKISGFWVPADPSFDDFLAAGIGFPLQRLGYDPLMLWGLTGTVIARTEEMPKEPNQWLRRRLFCAFSCGESNCLNLHTDDLRERGRQILADIGESEYILSKRRYYIPAPGIAELGVGLTP